MAKDTPIAAQATPPDPPADDASAVAEADRAAAAIRRAERRLHMLERASEITMDVMESLRRQVLAAETPRTAGPADAPAPASPAVPEPAAALAKLSRSLRLTLDLEARFDEALRALRAGEAEAQVARREKRKQDADQVVIQRRDDAKERVMGQVSVAIAREVESEAEECERLAALMERLDDDWAYDEVEDRPLREVVKQLCTDLGLTPDWSDWTEEGWPEPTESGPAARPRFSPFRQRSPRPLLKKNQAYPRTQFELARPPP